MKTFERIFRDKSLEFENGLRVYEYLSLMTFTYSAFINYPNSAMDGMIKNCSFHYLFTSTERVISQAKNYPNYFIKVFNLIIN